MSIANHWLTFNVRSTLRLRFSHLICEYCCTDRNHFRSCTNWRDCWRLSLLFSLEPAQLVVNGNHKIVTLSYRASCYQILYKVCREADALFVSSGMWRGSISIFRISLTLGKPVHFYWECQLCMFLHPTNFVRYCDFMIDNPQEGEFLISFGFLKIFILSTGKTFTKLLELPKFIVVGLY